MRDVSCRDLKVERARQRIPMTKLDHPIEEVIEQDKEKEEKEQRQLRNEGNLKGDNTGIVFFKEKEM